MQDAHGIIVTVQKEASNERFDMKIERLLHIQLVVGKRVLHYMLIGLQHMDSARASTVFASSHSERSSRFSR